MSEQLNNLFAQTKGLEIHQIKEWMEILSNFETRNKYEILDDAGAKVGFAAEDAGGLSRTMLRMWLKRHRPLDIHILDRNGIQSVGQAITAIRLDS